MEEESKKEDELLLLNNINKSSKLVKYIYFDSFKFIGLSSRSVDVLAYHTILGILAVGDDQGNIKMYILYNITKFRKKRNRN